MMKMRYQDIFTWYFSLVLLPVLLWSSLGDLHGYSGEDLKQLKLQHEDQGIGLGSAHADGEAGGKKDYQSVGGRKGAVSSESEPCSRIGIEVLEKGGNAADAVCPGHIKGLWRLNADTMTDGRNGDMYECDL